MPPIHQEMAAGRWHSLSLAEQMGNIGSEYERTLSWRRRGKPDLARGSFERMLELFDLTLSDRRWKGLRLREIARAREAVCHELEERNPAGSFSKYFYYLAVLARRERGLA